MIGTWDSVALGDICEIERGASPRPIDQYITDDEDGVNWIKIGDVAEGEKYIWTTRQKIKREGARRSRFVESGDFLLTNSMSFGRPYILRTSGCVHDGWLVLRYDKNRVMEDYLYHVLSSDFIYAQFSRFAAGAVVKNLNSDVVKRVEIPLPPLPEQARLAAILDQADALRAKRREALTQIDSLAQSIFVEMFGDPVSSPKESALGTLGETVEEMQYGPRFYDEAYSPSGVRIVRITDLDYSGMLDFQSMPMMEVDEKTQAQFMLRPGDIIFARTGATVGKVALIDESNPPCIAGAYFIRLRFNRDLLPEYALAVLRSKSVQAVIAAQSRQAAQQNFSGPGLRRLPMPVPSRKLQDDFLNRIRALKVQRTKHQAFLSQMDSLFSSIQHRALNGEL